MINEMREFKDFRGSDARSNMFSTVDHNIDIRFVSRATDRRSGSRFKNHAECDWHMCQVIELHRNKFNTWTRIEVLYMHVYWYGFFVLKQQRWRSTHAPVFGGAVVAIVLYIGKKALGMQKSLISFHFLSKSLGRSSWKTWIVQNGSSQAKVSDASVFFLQL